MTGMTGLNEQPEGLRIPDELLGDPEDPEELIDREEEIREAVWLSLVRGIDDRDRLVRVIRDLGDGQWYGDAVLSNEQCAAIVQHLINARRAQQEEIGYVPDTNLDRAFDALRRARVVAEADFACCSTCGSAEIGRAQAHELDQWLGYVFFHQLDMERLVATGRTYLDYGIFWPAHLTREEFDALDGQQREEVYKSRTLALMRTVVIPVVRAYDIDVLWNGSFETRIMLSNVEWYAPLQAHIAPRRSLVS